jgi:PadR family transcriptional regulator PadR
MKINEIPRGQLSTIILSSLLDGDKYGYEIIASVEEKTNGEVLIKKPSLYSTLNRMEKQDLLSSYWRDSELGGKRHYYRLTDFGKKQVLQWQDQLYSSQNKLSQILQRGKQNKSESQQLDAISNDNEDKVEENKQKNTFLQQENLFNLTSNLDNQDKQVSKQDNVQTQTNEVQTQQDFIQYDLFSNRDYIQTPSVDIEPKVALESDLSFTPINISKENNDIITPQPESENISNNQNESISKQELSSSFKENIAKLLESENSSFDEKLQKAKQSFNFESEYKKHLKSTKSYAETLDDNKQNSTTSPTSFFSANELLKNDNVQAPQSFAGFNSKDDDNPYKDMENTLFEKDSIKKITPSFFEETATYEQNNLKEQNEYYTDKNTGDNEFKENADFELEKNLNNTKLSEQELSKNSFNNHSVESEETTNDIPTQTTFIKERIENPPKVKKITPASFVHLNNNSIPKKQDQSASSNISQHEAQNSEQNEELSNLSENLQANRKVLTAEEKYFNQFKISVSNYSKTLEKTTKTISVKTSNEFLKINKFNLYASLSILILFFAQAISFILIFAKQQIDISTALWLYSITAFVGLIWFGFSLFKFLKNKHYKVKKQNLNITPLWQKLIFITIFLVLVYSIHVLIGMTEFNYKHYLPTLLLPTFICFNFIVYHFVQLFSFK